MAEHASPARRIAIIIIVLLILGVAGWWAWTQWGEELVAKSNTTTLSGTVEADEFQVSSVMSGKIESSSATEGAAVTTGQTLFVLDDAILQQQVKQAEAGVSAAQAALTQAKIDNASSAAIAAAQAKVDQANATLAMTKVQLGYATITAATNGVITAVAANVGENASPGKSLATISDLSALHVSVYVPETDVGNVSLGQKATISTDSTSRTFPGTVDFIASQAEFTPSNIETKDQRVKLVYEVRVKIENADDVLKPGLPVDVVFE